MQYNLYLYCNDNPVNNTDPSGCFAFSALAVAGLIAVGAVVGGAVCGGIDYGFQCYEQKDEDLKVIDKSRIIKTGIESGICAAIPAITGSYFAAFGTGLVWGEGSILVGFGDSIYNYIFGD